MSRKLVIIVVAIAILAGIAIGFIRGLPNDFDPDAPPAPVDYSYRCGDGSEFRVYPVPLSVELYVVPATSADYLAEQSIPRQSEFVFQSTSTKIVRNGDDLELTVVGHPMTTCKPMFPVDQTFFHS